VAEQNADPEAWLADQLAQLEVEHDPFGSPSLAWSPGEPAFTAIEKLAQEYGEMCVARALAEPVVEHGAAFKGGDVQVWVDIPEVEEVYPMANRIQNHRRNGGTVLQRKVIVVENWTEVR
jgi:hypothetical protein